MREDRKEKQVPLGEPVGQNQPKTKEVKMKDRITSLIVNLTEEFISGKISKVYGRRYRGV